MADKKESPDINDLEDISLSENELDNILGSAELSEIDLETPADETVESSESLSLDDPSLDDSGLVGLDADLSGLDVDQSPSDEASDHMSGGDISDLAESLDAIDDLPSLEAEEDFEKISKSAITDNDGIESKNDDEIISLSENEMDNILQNVDDSQVIELENDADENGSPAFSIEDEAVTLSVDELDNIALDIEEGGGSPLSDASESTLKSSRDFEDEIMQDANVSMKKVAATPSAKSAISAAAETQKNKPVVKHESVHRSDETVRDADLRELFSYLDGLLEHLPEEKVREFAESPYYDKYISIINRLGL